MEDKHGPETVGWTGDDGTTGPSESRGREPRDPTRLTYKVDPLIISVL